MNKIPCELIKDLLPSYIDSLTSERSRELIDEHLQDCPDCRDTLKHMRGENDQDMKPDEDDKKEIAFLKKTKRMQKIAILSSAAAVILCALFILLRFFIMGISYNGAYYMIDKLSVEDGTVTIKASSADSSHVISRISFEEADGILTLKTSEVPESIFCRAGKEFSYKLKQPDALKTIRLGEQIIWEDGSRISPVTSVLYRAKHAYIGDMPANQKSAKALNISTVLGEYDNQLQTGQEPYGWTIRLKNDIPAGREALLNSNMEAVAYLLIATIKNLDHVSFEYTLDGDSRSLSFDAADATAYLGRDIKDCFDNILILDELVTRTGL